MDVQQGNVVNSKMMSQLRPGMTKSQVKFILGTPLIQDSFHSNRWDYYYQMRKGGAVIEQRRVILDFENDLLKGVRGDVIPAGSGGDQAEGAPMAELAAQPKTEEKKGLVDKLKFWDKDAKPAAVAKPLPAPAETIQPEAPTAAPEKAPEPQSAAPVVEPVAIASAAVAAPVDVVATESQSATVDEKQLAPEAVPQAEVAGGVAAVNSDLTNPEVVAARVGAWAEAWRNKDVSAYLKFYSDKFTPDTASSKKAWVTQRKQRLSQPGKISLVLGNVKVSVDGEAATAEFTQHYNAQGFSDNVNKVLKLNLERTKGNWFIVKESVTVEPVANSVAVGNAVATTESVPPESSSPADADAITVRVNAWADAWRNKDIESYLGFYADKFIPDGQPSKKAWASQRRQRLAKPGVISLELDGVKPVVEGKQAKVSFVQRYSANGYSDNVSKVLVLQRIDNNWLIVKETVASKLIKIDTASNTAESKAPKLTPEQKSESMPEYPTEVPLAPQSVEPAVQSSFEPEAAPVAADTAEAAKTTQSEPAKAEEKDQPLQPEPSFFERMLEKIGF
ncbi:MAG: outer membrane protein assembly factor BamE [Candidatus Methylopumilus sp.]|jgi:outer membrane protein assembly factor BamE